MAGFLYFVEGSPENRVDILKQHKLAYALDGNCGLSPIALGATPSGKPGCLLSDSARHKSPPTFRADVQSWQRFRNHWVGYYLDDPPRPEELQREKLIPGYTVELGDGNKWQVPLARQYSHEGEPGSHLPHKLKVNELGVWTVGDVIDRYEDVWSTSVDFFNLWHDALIAAIEDGKDSFVFDHAHPQSASIKILSANYAISDVEASLLGLLLSDDTAGQIMRAACDCDVAMAWILDSKKNEPESETSTSEDGVEDFIRDTPQPLLT